jgi:serine/threonine protein phosphatase PrpC
MNVDPNADTAEIPIPVGMPPPLMPHAYSARVKVDVAARSDRGKVRANNEDHFLVARFGRYLDVLTTNLPSGEISDRVEEAGYGLIVADGMGGEAGGEVASRLAIRTLVDLVLDTPDWILRLDEERIKVVIERAKARIREIGALITRQATEDPRLWRMGTTMTMAYNLGHELLLAHVGDSRAYHFRDGELQQLTRDHTMAQKLIDLGELSRDEATAQRLRHVLTNALGRDGRDVQVDVLRLRIRDGDSLLLCTDGLTDMVPDERIAAALAESSTAEACCQSLVEQALAAGGKDNVTVVVARYAMPDPRL